MKLHALLATALLCVFFVTRDECRAELPVLTRAGEEYFIRLSPRASAVKRAPRLQVRRGFLGARAAKLTDAVTESASARELQPRSEDSPISLDLTFHLLREVLQMARAERLAQQVNSNRRMMEMFGK
ncbi:corticoliberin-1-like [Hoplias malabaricus]|uniref:corticoliberin-1-like n=1 Tax=Hoplias malabaricus TaxID=27720 RepID=UPI00346309F2